MTTAQFDAAIFDALAAHGWRRRDGGAEITLGGGATGGALNPNGERILTVGSRSGILTVRHGDRCVWQGFPHHNRTPADNAARVHAAVMVAYTDGALIRSLYDPRATRSGQVHYVHFVIDHSDRVAVLTDQCNYETVEFLTVEQARAEYARRTGHGFKPYPNGNNDQIRLRASIAAANHAENLAGVR